MNNLTSEFVIFNKAKEKKELFGIRNQLEAYIKLQPFRSGIYFSRGFIRKANIKDKKYFLVKFSKNEKKIAFTFMKKKSEMSLYIGKSHCANCRSLFISIEKIFNIKIEIKKYTPSLLKIFEEKGEIDYWIIDFNE